MSDDRQEKNKINLQLNGDTVKVYVSEDIALKIEQAINIDLSLNDSWAITDLDFIDNTFELNPIIGVNNSNLIMSFLFNQGISFVEFIVSTSIECENNEYAIVMIEDKDGCIIKYSKPFDATIKKYKESEVKYGNEKIITKLFDNYSKAAEYNSLLATTLAEEILL